VIANISKQKDRAGAFLGFPMSVIGERAAVVSLGVSCQSGEQIRVHADLITRLVGDPTMRIATSVFDNIICTPASAIRMLETDTFYPADPAALSVSQGAYWNALDVYFWHEYRLHKRHVLEYLFGRVNKRRAYRELSGKYAHLAARFRSLRSRERLVFVISNSQNNLDDYAVETGISPVLSADDVARLCDACDAYMGKACDYILATYDDRLTGTPHRPRLRHYSLRKDDSPWKGDTGQWEWVFGSYFSSVRRPATG
jgi:hypothetical protein